MNKNIFIDYKSLLRENLLNVIKHALRNKLARHEVGMIKKGQDVSSIIDN